jgi:hypothetical protein
MLCNGCFRVQTLGSLATYPLPPPPRQTMAIFPSQMGVNQGLLQSPKHECFFLCSPSEKREQPDIHKGLLGERGQC